MNRLRIYPSSVNDRFLQQAVDAINHGDIIIYPTDTIYALGCDALNQQAIERLCRLKNINPLKNTLSIVCADMSQASEYARIDNRAFALMRRLVPGPFTFILPSAPALPRVFKGRRTVGVRIPDNSIARALAEALGHPLLTTSLPVDGLDSDEIVSPDDILQRCQSWPVSLMIDGGQGFDTPSTIIDLTDSSAPEIIRQGRGITDDI